MSAFQSIREWVLSDYVDWAILLMDMSYISHGHFVLFMGHHRNGFAL